MDFAIASTPRAAVESPFDGIIEPLHPGSSTLGASRWAINPEILPCCPEMAAFVPTVIRRPVEQRSHWLPADAGHRQPGLRLPGLWFTNGCCREQSSVACQNRPRVSGHSRRAVHSTNIGLRTQRTSSENDPT